MKSSFSFKKLRQKFAHSSAVKNELLEHNNSENLRKICIQICQAIQIPARIREKPIKMSPDVVGTKEKMTVSIS